jgi:hypothetical protein
MTGEPQSADAPFGHAGERLHEWMFGTRFWDAGGTAGVDDAFAERHSYRIGAEIMGANSDPTIAPKITNDVRKIASKIQAADDTARLSWTSYYNIATTGTAVKIPAVCTIPFTNAMAALHGATRAGLAETRFTWIDIDSVIGLRDRLLQDLYPSDIVYKKSGVATPKQGRYRQDRTEGTGQFLDPARARENVRASGILRRFGPLLRSSTARATAGDSAGTARR